MDTNVTQSTITTAESSSTAPSGGDPKPDEKNTEKVDDDDDAVTVGAVRNDADKDKMTDVKKSEAAAANDITGKDKTNKKENRRRLVVF